jgi:hypothetical protein
LLLGMRLARDHELNRSFAVRQNPQQTIRIKLN